MASGPRRGPCCPHPAAQTLSQGSLRQAGPCVATPPSHTCPCSLPLPWPLSDTCVLVPSTEPAHGRTQKELRAEAQGLATPQTDPRLLGEHAVGGSAGEPRPALAQRVSGHSPSRRCPFRAPICSGVRGYAAALGLEAHPAVTTAHHPSPQEGLEPEGGASGAPAPRGQPGPWSRHCPAPGPSASPCWPGV